MISTRISHLSALLPNITVKSVPDHEVVPDYIIRMFYESIDCNNSGSIDYPEFIKHFSQVTFNRSMQMSLAPRVKTSPLLFLLVNPTESLYLHGGVPHKGIQCLFRRQVKPFVPLTLLVRPSLFINILVINLASLQHEV